MSHERTAAPIRILVVEDEPLARAALIASLGRLEGAEVVGTATDGLEATRLLDSLEPDLVFLDVQLPGRDGIAALREASHQPSVVFTTAYDRYAVTAFELAAIDYLLKPYDEARLREALDRVRTRLWRDEASADSRAPELHERLRALFGSGGEVHTLFLRDRGQIVPIPIDDVTRFEADDIYVGVFARGRRFLVHLALADLEKRLPREFIRVHRSHIVNIRHVATFAAYDASRLSVTMRDGVIVVASRAHSRRLRHLSM